jgi:YbbR domain-containing protein
MKWTNLKWWLPKIVCFIAACAFWVYVMNEQNPQVETSYTVPVEARNLDRSLVAVNMPGEVRVKVRMSRSEMISTRAEDIKAYVDMSQMTSGSYPNTEIQVSVPSDEVVVSTTPSTFDLKIEPYAVKSLPIEVNIFGAPVKSYTPSMDSITPDTVTVAGSQSSVASATKAIVSVNVGGKTADFSEYDTINILDDKGQHVTGLTIMPLQVKVSMKVVEDQRTRNVPLEVHTTGTPAEGYVLKSTQIRPAQATVTAPISFFTDSPEISLPDVDITGESGTVVKTVEIPAPEGGSVIPKTADVILNIEQGS